MEAAAAQESLSDDRSGSAISGEVILVVEDDRELARAIAGLLSDEGYRILYARHGKEAFERLENQPVDLIVLDLRLPVMDGWKFRTIQRADQRYAHIPVVAVSADDSPQAEAIDAAGYLRKPFKSEELLLVVERVLLSTQRRNLADKLRETERLTTLGTIAASVAHEINNPLTYVLGNLHILQSRLATQGREPPSTSDPALLDDMGEMLGEIRIGAERIRHVVETLRNAFRPSEPQRSWVDINAIAQTSIAIAWHEIRHRARLRTELETVPPVFGNDARLGQVLVNLLVNAAQSIPAGAVDQHEIVVRTSSSPDEVAIEISDTGSGIPKELQPRVFEPFFTTKRASRGSGIGLTVSRNIVAEHQGRIELESRPGAGTTFRVLLPTEQAQTVTAPRPAAADRVAAPSATVPVTPETTPRRRSPGPGRTRRPRVLVIDDDPWVGASTLRMLEPEHRVVVVDSARKALGLIQAGQRFDVFVCDVVMPDMTGIQFCAELERQRPGASARLIFVTGGELMAEVEAFRAVTRNVWIDKPFDPATLLGHLRGVLDRLGPA